MRFSGSGADQHAGLTKLKFGHQLPMSTVMDPARAPE